MAQTSNASFGLMSANIQAALGVKQAIQTADYATEILKQQCTLQSEEAKVMGGAEGPKGNFGILGSMLNTSIIAAEQQKGAMDDEAIGKLVSGGLTLAAAGGTLICMKTTPSSPSDEELKSLNSFKKSLQGPSADALVVQEHTDESGATEAAAKARIAKWKGTEETNADFSTVDEKDETQDKAIALLKKPENASEKEAILKNLQREITQRQSRVASEKSNMQNMQVQFINMGNQTATSFTQGTAETYQARMQQSSAIESADSKMMESAEQAVSQLYNTAGSQASQEQQMINQTLQAIAFPA